MLRAYMRVLEKRPLLTQCVSSAVIAGGGDAISQVVIERRNLQQYDFTRTARFGLLAGLFIAPVLSQWFRVLELIKGGNKKFVPLKRVLIDQSTFSPFFNGVILFNLRFLEGYGIDDSFNMMKRDWWPVWSSSLLFWPCVQLCNFYLAPLNMRVVYTQIAGLAWNSYLSYKTQAKLPTADHVYRYE